MNRCVTQGFQIENKALGLKEQLETIFRCTFW